MDFINNVLGLPPISLYPLIWLLPVAFVIHDGEEILCTKKWLRSKGADLRIPAAQRKLLSEEHVTFQLTVAVTLMALAILILTYNAAEHFAVSGELLPLYAGIVAVMLLDGVKHVGLSVLVRSYTPGVITALLVEIPYAAFALSRFFTEGHLEGYRLLSGMALGLPLTLLMVWGGLELGKLVRQKYIHT